MDRKQLNQLAGELGLERAYELNPQAFAAALEKAHAHSAFSAPAASCADEPAHVLILPDRSKTGSESPDGG